MGGNRNVTDSSYVGNFFGACDSDGKIANFISTRNVAHYMPVHSLKQKEPYYVAVFLVGAYQEILGDMHNLFGDTNAVHVSVNEKGYNIEQIIDGETVAEVLDYVQYSPKKLVRTLETWVTKSVKEGKISVEEGKEFLSNYRSGLYGYTYLEEIERITINNEQQTTSYKLRILHDISLVSCSSWLVIRGS